MKKLLAMLGATGLVVSTGAILVSCNEKTTPKDEPTELPIRADGVTFDEAAELNSIVMTVAKEATPETLETPEATVKGITLKDGYTLDADTNTKLTGTLLIEKDVEPGNYVATFTADKKAATKEEEAKPLTVTYEFTVEAAKAELSTVLKVTELGTINDKDLKTIVAGIKKVNTPETDFGTLSFKDDVEATEIKATMVSDKFDGEVVVTYTIEAVVTPDPELSTVIEETKLGEIPERTEAAVIKALKVKNIKLKAEDKDITVALVGEENKANISVTGFKNSVEVTFELPKVDPELSTVIEEAKLGEIPERTEAAVIKALKAKNIKLKAEDKDITVALVGEENKANISVTGFKNSVEVTFTIKVIEE